MPCPYMDVINLLWHLFEGFEKWCVVYYFFPHYPAERAGPVKTYPRKFMSLYKNKYRIESARLKEWDYANPWWYYVTINTKDHIPYFGEIVDEGIVLNELGLIADTFWKQVPVHYQNVELDYFVVMPNHIHGIIILNDRRDVACNVSTETLNLLWHLLNGFKKLCV